MHCMCVNETKEDKIPLAHILDAFRSIFLMSCVCVCCINYLSQKEMAIIHLTFTNENLQPLQNVSAVTKSENEKPHTTFSF